MQNKREFSRSAIVLFVVGTILYASNSTIVVFSKGGSTHIKFHLSVVVLFAEILRLFGALFLVFTFGFTQELQHFFNRKLCRFAVPAFIYAINDEIAFRCMEHMDSATFQTLSNFKILTTALLCYFCLGHKVTKRQWLALSILTVATIGGALSNTTTSGGAGIARHELHHHHKHHHMHFKRIITATSLNNQESNGDGDDAAGVSTFFSTNVEDNHNDDSSSNTGHTGHPSGWRRRELLFFAKKIDYSNKYHFSKSHPTISTSTASITVSNSLGTAGLPGVNGNANKNENENGHSHNASIASIPDELEDAINNHRFFITREGIVLVLLYSILSAAAAAYSEWLLRVSHVKEDKGHGKFATPALRNYENIENGAGGVVGQQVLVRNRMLMNSPSTFSSGTLPPTATSAITPLSTIGLHKQEEGTHMEGSATTPAPVHSRYQYIVHNESLPTKMVRIYFWGILFSIFHCIIEMAWQHEAYGTNSSLLDGFNFFTWLLVANQALMGLVLTAIIHQMGAISKLFLLSIAMILTSIVTIFFFHLIPNVTFCLSFAMIIGSILLYNHEEFFEADKNGANGQGIHANEMTPMKRSMAKVANRLYAYMFAATVLFVLGGGVAASLSIHEKFNIIHT